jgi:hypothetical protein
MAVPMTVKMPEPMTAPMPSAVRDQGPSDFLSAFSGSSESRISLSMDLRANSWLGSAVLLLQPSNPLGCLPKIGGDATWAPDQDDEILIRR